MRESLIATANDLLDRMISELRGDVGATIVAFSLENLGPFKLYEDHSDSSYQWNDWLIELVEARYLSKINFLNALGIESNLSPCGQAIAEHCQGISFQDGTLIFDGAFKDANAMASLLESQKDNIIKGINNLPEEWLQPDEDEIADEKEEIVKRDSPIAPEDLAAVQALFGKMKDRNPETSPTPWSALILVAAGIEKLSTNGFKHLVQRAIEEETLNNRIDKGTVKKTILDLLIENRFFRLAATLLQCFDDKKMRMSATLVGAISDNITAQQNSLGNPNLKLYCLQMAVDVSPKNGATVS